METFGALGVMAIAIIIIVVSVLAFLMPLFVLRIRNEMILMNKQLSILLKSIKPRNITVTCPGCQKSFEMPMTAVSQLVICPHCKRKDNSDFLQKKSLNDEWIKATKSANK